MFVYGAISLLVVPWLSKCRPLVHSDIWGTFYFYPDLYCVSHSFLFWYMMYRLLRAQFHHLLYMSLFHHPTTLLCIVCDWKEIPAWYHWNYHLLYWKFPMTHIQHSVEIWLVVQHSVQSTASWLVYILDINEKANWKLSCPIIFLQLPGFSLLIKDWKKMVSFYFSDNWIGYEQSCLLW